MLHDQDLGEYLVSLKETNVLVLMSSKPRTKGVAMLEGRDREPARGLKTASIIHFDEPHDEMIMLLKRKRLLGRTLLRMLLRTCKEQSMTLQEANPWLCNEQRPSQ